MASTWFSSVYASVSFATVTDANSRASTRFGRNPHSLELDFFVEQDPFRSEDVYPS